MASPVFAFYLTCLLLGKMGKLHFCDSSSYISECTSTSVHQERRFVSAHVGDKVNLECFSEDKIAPRVYWYKHSLGQKPRLISSSYKYDVDSTFYHEFKNNPRFTMDTENSKTHLMITDLRNSDSATYYPVKYSYALEFSEIITVSVKGSDLNIQALAHQSESETLFKEPNYTVVHSELVIMFPIRDIQRHFRLANHTQSCHSKEEKRTRFFPLSTMISAQFVLYLTCLFLGRMGQVTNQKFSVHQDTRFVSANVGESLTLGCFYEGDDVTRLYWYKQILGQKPRLISTLYVFNRNGSFHDEFKNNPRFTLDTGKSKYSLKITDLHISDSATYYCATRLSLIIEFAEGTIVNVKNSGLNIQALVRQSESETIQSGGSVTLNCTVHTGTCDGEHSVYWFKSSEESHPGLIYTHGDRNDQCERKPNTQTHTCVYNLPMKNLSLSHAGTYYCAVASCGHILFGNGTNLDIEDKADLMYFWHGVSAFTTILSVLLAFSLCMMAKRSSCQSTESQPRFTVPYTANKEGYQHAEQLYYAALSVKLSNRSRRQRDQTWSECVYYSAKQ